MQLKIGGKNDKPMSRTVLLYNLTHPSDARHKVVVQASPYFYFCHGGHGIF
jgi:hypothetical protein